MEIKKDCFAYNEEKRRCNALNDLYCKKEKCNFYRNKNTFKIKNEEYKAYNY